MSLKQKTILLLIMVLAVFFRFYLITEMPGGLFPDEAANGLDINSMQQGHLQPFYERGNGREALFFYMLWGSVEIFGKGPWQHHIVSALVGVISVLLCFLVTRKLFSFGDADEQNKNKAVWIALIASFLMATSTWHTVLSRTAFRANLIPLFSTLTLYLLLLAYDSKELKRKLVFAFLTGTAFALGFYTYIAYRIMVPILATITLWPLLFYFKDLRREGKIKDYISQAAIFTAGLVIFIYPLAYYFQTHPGSFVGRSGQVSIFNEELYRINGEDITMRPTIGQVGVVAGEVLKVSLAAYFTEGDLNWRHNISGYPFLSPLVSPFFGVALVAVSFMGIWYFFRPKSRPNFWKYFLLTGWFWGMILPVITTAEGIPHGLRSIGTIPAVFIISAWVVYFAAAQIRRFHDRLYVNWSGLDSWQYKLTTKAIMAVPVVFALALILQTYLLYFVYAYNSPENFHAFRSDLTPVSAYLKQYGNKATTYFVSDTFSVQTIDYLTTVDAPHPENPKNQPYTRIEPGDVWKLEGLKKGDQVVFNISTISNIKDFIEHHPEVFLAIEIRNKFNQAVMAVYKVY